MKTNQVCPILSVCFPLYIQGFGYPSEQSGNPRSVEPLDGATVDQRCPTGSQKALYQVQGLGFVAAQHIADSRRLLEDVGGNQAKLVKMHENADMIGYGDT